MSPEATISWISNCLLLELPPDTKTSAFMKHYGDLGEQQTRLRTLIDCQKCDMLDSFPLWASERIRPQLGHRFGDDSTLLKIEIGCEGMKPTASCRTRFRTPQTVEIELD